MEFISRAKAYITCPYKEKKCLSFDNFLGDNEALEKHAVNCPCAKFKAWEAVQDPKKVEAKLSELGVNQEMETWKLLMTMQKQFAGKFHKVEGLTKEEVDHWVNEYLVCIEDEVREVREHLGFYNEKSYSNLEELKKEIIDILHFVMDEFIVGGLTPETLKAKYLSKYAANVVEVKDFLKFAYEQQKSLISFDSEKRDYNLFIAVNKLLDCSGSVRQQISWKHWKKPSPTIDYDKLHEAFADTFKVLVDLFCILDMTSDDVRSIYIKKNLENIFRQEFNY